MTHTQRIKRYVQFFGSFAKTLEVLAVWENIKPCARILVYEDDAPKTISYLRSFPLQVVTADFKIDLWQSSTASGYSSKGGIIPVSGGEGRKGYLVLYVSKDLERALAAKAAEQAQDHASLGAALGYPGCCSRFFSHYAQEEQKRHNTFIRPLLEHSARTGALGHANHHGAHQFPPAYPFQNNIFLRAQDICLLSHIPCSLDCPKSLEEGNKMMRLLQRYSASIAQEFGAALKKGVLVTEEGISILLEGTAITGATVSIKAAASPDPFARVLVEQLTRAKAFEALPQGGILVEEMIYSNYTFVQFS